MFSIEVTSMYFAVRNYWRGFFTAACAAIFFRLFPIWFEPNAAHTFTALFPTTFRTQMAFQPVELLVFAAMGILCGLFGAAYVLLHRNVVKFQRKLMKKLQFRYLPKFIFIYPVIVSLLYSTLMFPPWLGQYMGARLPLKKRLLAFFYVSSWLPTDADNLNSTAAVLVADNFAAAFPDNSLSSSSLALMFGMILVYCVAHFIATPFAITLPIPSGKKSRKNTFYYVKV